MSTKRGLIVALAALAGAGGITAVGCEQPGLDNSGPMTLERFNLHDHSMLVEWVHVGVEQLLPSSDAVVRGHVVSQRESWMKTGQDPSPNPKDLIAITISTVMIDEVFQAANGQPIAVGARIEVEELGGRFPDGCWVTPNSQPIMAPGDQALFLLSAGGRAYHVVGGHRGKIAIHEGVLQPSPEGILGAYAGLTPAQLIGELRHLPAP